MSAVDRTGPVAILMGGVVATVPYRRAVGLVATGRASFYTPDPSPQTSPAKPVKPKTQTVPVKGPEVRDVPPGTSSPSIVSVPTRKGAEGEETEDLPSPPDR